MIKPSSRSLRRSLPLFVVLALALAFRVALTWRYYHHPLFGFLRLDEVEYDGYARDLLSQGLALDYVPIHAPGYFYFLALLYRCAEWAGEAAPPRELLYPRLFQVVFGLGAVFVAHRIAKKLFGAGSALVAAMVLGLYWPLMIFEQRLLAVSLYLFLTLLGLLAVLWAEDRGSAPRWWLAGLCAGLAILVYPTATLWTLTVPAWLGLRWRREQDPRRALHGLVFLAAVAIPLAPAVVHNHAVSGEWFLLQRNGGLNFYVGNNPASDGTPYARPGGTWDAIDALPLEEAGLQSESEQDRFYLKKILEFMRDDPVRFARLEARKALMMFNRHETRSTLDPAFHRRLFSVLDPPLPGFGVIMTLAAPGALIFRRMSARRWLFVSFLAANWAAVASTMVACRYRMVFTAGMAMLAGAGFMVLADAVKNMRRAIAGRPRGSARSIAWPFVLAGLGLGLAWLPVAPHYDDSEELAYLGDAYVIAGEVDRAADCYRRARDLDTESVPALLGLARIEALRGDLASGLDYARQAAARDPQSAAAGMVLAELLWRAGRRDEAIAQMEDAVTKRPQWVNGLYGLAVFHSEAGDRARARELYRIILGLRPDFDASERFLEAIGEKPERKATP